LLRWYRLKETKTTPRLPSEREHALCGNDRKALTEIKARLKTEMRDGSDAGSIIVFGAAFKN
jgi:hypothetical protein